MGYYIRADMAKITVSVDSQQVGPDMWATFSGGGLDTDDQKTRPGGMQNQVAIGGPTSRDDITVTTQFTDLVASVAKALELRTGRGSLTVAVTYKDPDGNNVSAHGFTRTGIVKSVQIPNVDVNTGDVAFLTVVGSMNEVGA
jgi:hypothetical protein